MKLGVVIQNSIVTLCEYIIALFFVLLPVVILMLALMIAGCRTSSAVVVEHRLPTSTYFDRYEYNEFPTEFEGCALPEQQETFQTLACGTEIDSPILTCYFFAIYEGEGIIVHVTAIIGKCEWEVVEVEPIVEQAVTPWL